jgi:hypothetical protein
MPLKVEVAGGTTRNNPGMPAVTGTSTSLYFPLEVEAMLAQVVSGQSIPLTEVVPNTECTTVPADTTPAAAPRPPAWHDVAEEQEIVCSVVVPCTISGVPGFPAVIGSTTPWPPPTPTASQEVEVGHETERSDLVPTTRCGTPGDPLVTITTTPWPLSALAPTASHEVAVGHEIAVSSSTAVTVCRETTWPAVDGDEVEVDEDDEGEWDAPQADSDTASVKPSTTNDLRTTSPRWIACSSRRRMGDTSGSTVRLFELPGPGEFEQP